jgi:hypothetical protein
MQGSVAACRQTRLETWGMLGKHPRPCHAAKGKASLEGVFFDFIRIEHFTFYCYKSNNKSIF